MSTDLDCRTCMNFSAFQSACNSIQRCQGEECLDGDLYEQKQALSLWNKSQSTQCQHIWKWHPIAGEGKICALCGLRDFKCDD